MIGNEPFRAAMDRCPLVAVLRGIRPHEIIAIADALVEAGFTMIEVTLNSPDPLTSISTIAKRYPSPVLVGAGTVLSTDEVHAVAQAGGVLIVSPNADAAVIAAAASKGLVPLPGFFTPSEAFTALAAGAAGLKFFPAEAASPAVLKAQRAVIPRSVPIFAVGGIVPEDMAPWRAAGADGFGLGSALYRAGDTAAQVAGRARAFVAKLSG